MREGLYPETSVVVMHSADKWKLASGRVEAQGGLMVQWRIMDGQIAYSQKNI